MQTLKNWSAKRAGGRITISGIDAATNQPCKIVGVDRIEAGRPPVAIDKDDVKYELA